MHNINFHDSVIVALEGANGVLTIKLESVETDKGPIDVTFHVSGVSEMRMDHEKHYVIGMTGDDGEVLKLDWKGSRLEMLVIWENYKARQRSTCLYEIEFSGAITLTM